MWTNRDLKFKDCLSLIGCKVDTVSRSKTSFKLTNGEKTSLFQCESQEERDEWILEIRKNAEAATKGDQKKQEAIEKQKQQSRQEVKRKLHALAKRRRSGKASLRSPLKQMMERQESLSQKIAQMDPHGSIGSLPREGSTTTPLDLRELRQSITELENEEAEIEKEKDDEDNEENEENKENDHEEVKDETNKENGEGHEDDHELDSVEEAIDDAADAQLMKMRLNFIRQVSSRGAMSPDAMRETAKESASKAGEADDNFLDLLDKHDMIPTKVGSRAYEHHNEGDNILPFSSISEEDLDKRVTFEGHEEEEDDEEEDEFDENPLPSDKGKPPRPLKRGMTGINEKDFKVSELKAKFGR